MIHGYSWCFPVLLPFHLSALLCPKCHTPGCPFLRHFHFCLPAYQRVPQDGQWQFQPLRYVFIGNQKKGLCQAEISSSTGPRHIFSCCILSCESLSWEKVARCTTYLVLYTSIISFDQLLSRIPCLAGIDKKHVPQHSPNAFITTDYQKYTKVTQYIYISTARHQRAHQNANKFQ